MANVPWNHQGAYTVYMSSIGNSFQGLGNALSQYWNGRDHFYNPDNGGTWYDQGTRSMDSWRNKSWSYIYTSGYNQGTGPYGYTIGSPNGYTNIYVVQGQGGSFQSIYFQTYYLARMFIRNYTYTTGSGGTGGRILQGYPFNPGASPGQPAFNIQGYAGYVQVKTQGFTLNGGGGGGGAGQQGSTGPAAQRQNTGGGGGGGGGGFGTGGARPDASRQGGTSQNGFSTTGGAGGSNGGSGAYTGGSGGNPGQSGFSPPGGNYVGGGAAGQNVVGGWQGIWIIT